MKEQKKKKRFQISIELSAEEIERFESYKKHEQIPMNSTAARHAMFKTISRLERELEEAGEAAAI